VAALLGYAWPGNVRELRNVLERALITSADGRLHLARALPAGEPPSASVEDEPRREGQILSERALRQLELDNMLAALARSGGRVGGEGGAARLLGVSPSTLKSRMKALHLGRGAPGSMLSPPSAPGR
jgi:transcriptional regulator of acetoin/glycerol metabolism